MKTVVGIDASRNRSGGAKAHLVGILKGADPTNHGISEVHVWTYKSLISEVPDYPWLVKHSPPVLEKSLLQQVWWQYRCLPHEAREYGCNVLYNTDAGTVCSFRPAVTLSQDMLPYEPGEIQRLGLSVLRWRYMLLSYIQSRSMRRSDGVVFLTNYAADVIQRSLVNIANTAIIAHGVDPAFKANSANKWPKSIDFPIQCLYVSNTAQYKHQWVVVKAIAALRRLGHNLHLKLVGGGTGRAQRLLDDQIAVSDPKRLFVEQLDYVPHSKIPSLLFDANIFVFASSCENMPVTLLEAMAAGLPIACSNRGPMPEILQDGGVYFDPEDSESIASAIEKIIHDQHLREDIAKNAKDISEQFSWARCASETYKFLKLIAIKTNNHGKL